VEIKGEKEKNKINQKMVVEDDANKIQEWYLTLETLGPDHREPSFQHNRFLKLIIQMQLW